MATSPDKRHHGTPSACCCVPRCDAPEKQQPVAAALPLTPHTEVHKCARAFKSTAKTMMCPVCNNQGN
jgi:hypothetical protein